MNADNKLKFGANWLIPESDVPRAAWGCRLIITQQGHVDFVPDRQDAIGPDEERKALLDWLNNTAKSEPTLELGRLLAFNKLSTRETKPVVLFEDNTGVVMGDPHSSAGYCYVAAWLK